MLHVPPKSKQLTSQNIFTHLHTPTHTHTPAHLNAKLLSPNPDALSSSLPPLAPHQHRTRFPPPTPGNWPGQRRAQLWVVLSLKLCYTQLSLCFSRSLHIALYRSHSCNSCWNVCICICTHTHTRKQTHISWHLHTRTQKLCILLKSKRKEIAQI